MGKVWVLDTETKGTGAEMVPLETALREPAPEAAPAERPRRARKAAEKGPSPARRSTSTKARRPDPAGAEPGNRDDRAERTSTPLPPGHVRKKATGELGRVQSVDAKAGIAKVLWLKQGRTSAVPLTAISRR